MQFALELFFDSATEAEVRRVWGSISDRCGSRYLEENGVRPHIALIVFDANTPTASFGWRRILSAPDWNVSLKEHGRRVFETGVAFIQFQRNPLLDQLHDAALRFAADASLPVSPFYHAETWTPHCTLAQKVSLERIEEVSSMITGYSFKCPWNIKSAGIVSFPPTVVLDEKLIPNELGNPKRSA